MLAKQAADSLGDLQNWSVENVSNSGNVLLGFRAKQLAKLPTGAIVHSLKKIRQLHFAKDQVTMLTVRHSIHVSLALCKLKSHCSVRFQSAPRVC